MDQTVSSNAFKSQKKAKKKFNAVHLLGEVKEQTVKKYVNDLSHRYNVNKSGFEFDCLLCDSTVDSWGEFVKHMKNPSHLQQIKEDRINFTAICVACKCIFMTEDVNSIVKHFSCHQENICRTMNMTGTIDKTIPKKHKKIHENIFEGKENSNSSLDSIQRKLTQSKMDETHNKGGRHIVLEPEILEEQKPNPFLYKSVLEADSHIANDIFNLNSVRQEGQSRIDLNNSLSSMGLQSNDVCCSFIKTVTADSTVLKKKKNRKKRLNPKNSYQNTKYPVMVTDYINVADPSQLDTYQSTEKVSSRTKMIDVFKPISAHLKEEEESFQNKYDVTDDKELFNENQSVSDKDKGEITFYPKEANFSESAFQLLYPGVQNDFTITLDLNVHNIKGYTLGTYYAIYHFLRKLYFSCLICHSIRLKEEEFYLHLKGKKHKLKIESCGESTYCVKICDICQQFLFGFLGDIMEHFNSDKHVLNVKCKMDLIEQQMLHKDVDANAVDSGNLKLGWSGKLTSKCIQMFSSKEILNGWIESSLEDADKVVSMAYSVNRILENDISMVLKEEYNNFKIEFVGSRAYGLAKHLSDADIYLEIGDVSIEDLEKHFSKAVDLFKVKKTIKEAKVPIIRLEHNSLNITCDINCSNPIGHYCSELIKTYISLDPRIRWMVMAVREWGAANEIRGTRKFTSYGLTWLVLFFLMSPPIQLIPPVETLKLLHKGQKITINGWNSSFTTDLEEIKKIHDPLSCRLSKYELLGKFFQHYSMVNLKKLVLFPHDGMTYSRPFFANPHVLIHPLLHYNPDNQEPLKIGGQIMIIDSLRLRENILKSVDENLADHFKLICKETLTCGWWS